jgi:hypothetical protein
MTGTIKFNRVEPQVGFAQRGLQGQVIIRIQGNALFQQFLGMLFGCLSPALIQFDHILGGIRQNGDLVRLNFDNPAGCCKMQFLGPGLDRDDPELQGGQQWSVVGQYTHHAITTWQGDHVGLTLEYNPVLRDDLTMNGHAVTGFPLPVGWLLSVHPRSYQPS